MNSELLIGIPETTWLIREDAIRPGDVLLTKGKAIISNAISVLSDGKFSHAAVFVSPSSVLESYNLVDFAWLKPAGQSVENGCAVRWAKLPHDPIEAELWRHPRIETIPKDRFESVSFNIMEEYWGMEYSLYSRLIPLAQVPDTLRRLGLAATKIYDEYYERSQVPGPFCSELVAEFYQKLPLQLFVDQRKPCEVSPNDLANSELNHVPNAIVRHTTLRNFIPSENEKQKALEKIGVSFAALMQNMRSQRITMKGLDDLGEVTRQVQSQSDKWISDMLDPQKEELRNLIRNARLIPTAKLYEWISHLVANFRLVSSALQTAIKTRPTDEQNLKLWLNAFGKIGVSNLRLFAIVRCRCIKTIQTSLRKSRPLFWRIRDWSIRRSRKKS